MNGFAISQPTHVGVTSDTAVRCSSSCCRHARVAGDPVSLKCSDRTPWPRKAETAENGRRAADQLEAQRSAQAGPVRHSARDKGSESSHCLCTATTTSVEVSETAAARLTYSGACALRYRDSSALPTRGAETRAARTSIKGQTDIPVLRNETSLLPRTTPVVFAVFQSRGSLPAITPSATRTRGCREAGCASRLLTAGTTAYLAPLPVSFSSTLVARV